MICSLVQAARSSTSSTSDCLLLWKFWLLLDYIRWVAIWYKPLLQGLVPNPYPSIHTARNSLPLQDMSLVSSLLASHLEVINESHMHRVPKSKHIWFSCCTDTMYPINYTGLSQILYYYSIPEFFHAIAVIPMQVLLLCSMLKLWSFHNEKNLETTSYVQCCIHTNCDTGIRLSGSLSLLPSQMVRILLSSMLVAVLLASPSWVSWFCRIDLLACDDLYMCLAIFLA